MRTQREVFGEGLFAFTQESYNPMKVTEAYLV